MEYSKLATSLSLEATVKSLKQKGYNVFVAKDKSQALDKIKDIIPKGTTVMNGSSKSLEEIGFVDYLKSGNHGWNNLHEKIVNEKDPEKQATLRKQAVLSDFYLGSVHALTETGEFIVASNTGSQLPHIVFTSKNLILVVGTQKIVVSMEAAMDRLKTYVVPLENKRLKDKFGIETSLNKIVIFLGENNKLQRKINFILVGEKIGF